MTDTAVPSHLDPMWSTTPPRTGKPQAAYTPGGGGPLSPSRSIGMGSAVEGSSVIDDGASVNDLLSVLSQRKQRQEGDDEMYVGDARPLLPKVAFFMGDLRDGLAMVRRMCAGRRRLETKYLEFLVGFLFVISERY